MFGAYFKVFISSIKSYCAVIETKRSSLPCISLGWLRYLFIFVQNHDSSLTDKLCEIYIALGTSDVKRFDYDKYSIRLMHTKNLSYQWIFVKMEDILCTNTQDGMLSWITFVQIHSSVFWFEIKSWSLIIHNDVILNRLGQSLLEPGEIQ